MSGSLRVRNSSLEYPYWATAASLTAMKRSEAASMTHMGWGLEAKSMRKLRSLVRTRAGAGIPAGQRDASRAATPQSRLFDRLKRLRNQPLRKRSATAAASAVEAAATPKGPEPIARPRWRNEVALTDMRTAPN